MDTLLFQVFCGKLLKAFKQKDILSVEIPEASLHHAMLDLFIELGGKYVQQECLIKRLKTQNSNLREELKQGDLFNGHHFPEIKP